MSEHCSYCYDEISGEPADQFGHCAACATTTEDLADPRANALALVLECSPIDIDTDLHTDHGYKAEGGTYLVLRDYQADARAEELETDLVWQQIEASDTPEWLHTYIDVAQIVRERISENRGAILAPYDGTEEEQEFDGVDYYIYRIN